MFDKYDIRDFSKLSEADKSFVLAFLDYINEDDVISGGTGNRQSDKERILNDYRARVRTGIHPPSTFSREFNRMLDMIDETAMSKIHSKPVLKRESRQ